MDNTMMGKDKETVLLLHKSRLLREIQYYDKRIEEIKSVQKSISVQDDSSSDSDTDFSQLQDVGPTMPQLRQHKNMLKTCLQATRELTGMEILQYEVNVLIDPPELDGEPPVLEPGTWQDVTAECRIDLVPFSLMFFAHRADRKFAPTLYRGLKVTPVKTVHEVELAHTVLPVVKRPSDAVEMIRNYATAYRSRRASLSRLADMFGDQLHMEPLPTGGYLLKCADLIQLQWDLQNKWSPLARFHHRLVFDVEYMAENYIKVITSLHRQLSDPELNTDERTMLLDKLFTTCLEAQGPTRVLHESLSSDPESAKKLKSRRTTLDKEPDIPIMKSKDDLMAPPRTAPKRKKDRKSFGKQSRLSGKQSDVNGKMVEGDGKNTHGSGKKVNHSVNMVGHAKTSDKDGETTVVNGKNSEKISKNANEANEKSSHVDNIPENDKNSDNVIENIVNDVGKSSGKNKETTDGNKKAKLKNVAKDGYKKKANNSNIKTGKDKNVENGKSRNDKDNDHRGNKYGTETADGGNKIANDGKRGIKRHINTENGSNSKKPKYVEHNEKNVERNPVTKSAEKYIATAKTNKIPSAKKASNTTVGKAVQKEDGHTKMEHIDKNKEKSKIAKKVVKKVVARTSTGNKASETGNSVALSKNNIGSANKKNDQIAKNPNFNKNNEQKKVMTEKVVPNKTNTQSDKNVEKIVANVANHKNTQKAESTTDKQVANEKNLTKPKTVPNVASLNSIEKKVASTNKNKLTKNPLQISNKLRDGNTNKFNNKNEKENIQNKKISKIPQKNPAMSALKKNPLRMSPRRLGASGKLSNLVSGESMPLQRTIQKTTSIPRLATKPA